MEYLHAPVLVGHGGRWRWSFLGLQRARRCRLVRVVGRIAGELSRNPATSLEISRWYCGRTFQEGPASAVEMERDFPVLCYARLAWRLKCKKSGNAPSPQQPVGKTRGDAFSAAWVPGMAGGVRTRGRVSLNRAGDGPGVRVPRLGRGWGPRWALVVAVWRWFPVVRDQWRAVAL